MGEGLVVAANDHSVIRTKTADHAITTDYAAIMATFQDESNWFLRARGLWQGQEQERPLTIESVVWSSPAGRITCRSCGRDWFCHWQAWNWGSKNCPVCREPELEWSPEVDVTNVT